jgi:hypothetical protein
MQTFVVRVWAEAAGPEHEPEELRGIVEHLGSGESHAFKDDTELLSFLHERPWARAQEEGHGDGGGP